MTKNNGGKFIKGAFLGTLLGGLAGLLLAPRSGKETRKKIKDKAGDYAEKGKDMAMKVVDKAKDEINSGSKTLSEEARTVKENGSDLVDGIKSGIGNKTDKK